MTLLSPGQTGLSFLFRPKPKARRPRSLDNSQKTKGPLMSPLWGQSAKPFPQDRKGFSWATASFSAPLKVHHGACATKKVDNHVVLHDSVGYH